MDKSSRYEKVPIMNLFFVPLLSDAGLIRSTSFGRMMCQLLGGRMKNGLDKGPKAKLNKSSSYGSTTKENLLLKLNDYNVTMFLRRK